MIKLKRAYDPPERDDGKRVLVDRLWPRGLKKERARLDLWMKDIAPSDGLRKWFAHYPARWPEFRRRYMEELKAKKDLMEELRELSEKGTLTLVYGAKDTEHNQAQVLKEVLSRTRQYAKAKARAGGEATPRALPIACFFELFEPVFFRRE
jgi:uncharacterized protein YeaO (DUF488 family)